MGIYWVFFKAQGHRHEMKLQVDSKNRDTAAKAAQKVADEMNFGWTLDHVEACR